MPVLVQRAFVTLPPIVNSQQRLRVLPKACADVAM